MEKSKSQRKEAEQRQIIYQETKVEWQQSNNKIMEYSGIILQKYSKKSS
jgi:hypothetical protein